MTNNSDTDWHSYSDLGLLTQIGGYIKSTRVMQGKTQVQLAKEADISRSTLSPLENGESVTLETLIRVLRALDELRFMENFVIQDSISPMEMRKLKRKGVKQRVTKTKNR